MSTKALVNWFLKSAELAFHSADRSARTLACTTEEARYCVVTTSTPGAVPLAIRPAMMSVEGLPSISPEMSGLAFSNAATCEGPEYQFRLLRSQCAGRVSGHRERCRYGHHQKLLHVDSLSSFVNAT